LCVDLFVASNKPAFCRVKFFASDKQSVEPPVRPPCLVFGGRPRARECPPHQGCLLRNRIPSDSPWGTRTTRAQIAEQNGMLTTDQSWRDVIANLPRPETSTQKPMICRWSFQQCVAKNRRVVWRPRPGYPRDQQTRGGAQ
jgi:hypothetical protein